MIQQLVARLMATRGLSAERAAATVLTADPLDLALHQEQVWDAANLWASASPGPSGGTTRALWGFGAFTDVTPPSVPGSASTPAWDHLGYAYVVENTRVVPIFRKVVREFRSGEALGMASVETQRWLAVTESMLFGGSSLLGIGGGLRPDGEAVRRNAYWRLFGMDLAFGGDDNRPFVYDKAVAVNDSFVPLFEELLYELWQAMTNLRNTSGANPADDDRIFRLAEQLNYILNVRRQFAVLAREELTAATVLGWLELTLSANSPVVNDLRAQATNPADRLKIIGAKVQVHPHSRATSFFEMAQDLSMLLRTIEAGFVSQPQYAWLLYASSPPPGYPPLPPGAAPLGSESRRVITEWSAATGRDLKARKRPVEIAPRMPALTRRP